MGRGRILTQALSHPERPAPPARMASIYCGGAACSELGPLISEPGGKHRHRTLANGIRRERRQCAGFAIDAIGRQATGCRAGGEKKVTGRVETERAWDGFGRSLPQ